MTDEEQMGLLDEPGVLMRIATVGPDGSPLVTPIWLLHEEGSIWFTPRENSEWFRHLKRDPRVCLCIDESLLPYRKLIVQGEAELIYDIGNDDEWRDRYRRMALRYGPPEMADAYIEDTIDQPRGLYRLRLDQARVRSWRMPIEGESQDGIWHQRYYRRGTKLASD